jgi:hypothetical protein
LYTLTWKEKIRKDHVIGHPVSVQGVDDMHINKMNISPALARGPQQHSNYWEFLRSWGGKWVWDVVKDSQATEHNLSWLIQGMGANSLIWVTDGTYDRKHAPVISRGGWIIFCQTTGKRLVQACIELSYLVYARYTYLHQHCLSSTRSWAGRQR